MQLAMDQFLLTLTLSWTPAETSSDYHYTTSCLHSIVQSLVVVSAFGLQVEPLCEFPSLEFYHGQLKASPLLKCYSYPRLAHFWPKGTAFSVYMEHGVHFGLAGSAGGKGSTAFFLSQVVGCLWCSAM